MYSRQKREKELMDLSKRACILERMVCKLSHSTRWSLLIYHIFKTYSSVWMESSEKKRSCSPSLRERLAFQGPDTFYRKLQRVCSTILNFQGFHLLRQIGAGPLYPQKEILLVTCSIPDGNLDQCSNYNMNTRRKGYMRYLSAITNLSPPVIPISPFSSTYQILTIL